MASSYHLIVAIPDQEPICYAIKDEKVKIGRSPENDIQILVHEVSTSHCELVGDADGYEIVDRGSSNGTRVKGQGIRNGRVFLNDRDKILFGETVPGYFVVAEEDENFAVKKVISEVEEQEQERLAAASKEGESADVVAVQEPVPATTATSAQAGASTQVLKKKPALPALGAKSGAPAKKVPTLSRASGEKPKIPALSKPAPPAAAAPAEEPAESEPKPVADKPKVPALATPAAKVEPSGEPSADKPKLPVVQKLQAPATESTDSPKPAVPVLSRPGAAKKVPTLTKPGSTPKLATPSDNLGARKVPKLNLPKKGE